MVGPEIYVDVNVFVYWLGGHQLFGETSYKWVKEIERSARSKYITSTLTIYQLLIIIAGLTGKNLKDKGLVEDLMNSITGLPGLQIVPLTVEDFIGAKNLMDEYGLDFEDALHLASALRYNVKEIISNDLDFDRTPLKRIF